MKTITTMKRSKLAIFAAALFAVVLTFTPNANALTFGDPNDLGSVLFGIPSGDAERTSYVNHLIDMAPNSSDTFSGQTFFRSDKNPGPGFPLYPDAVFALNGTGTSIDLGDGTLYSYLFAKYDGPNAGAEVWYVGGQTGIVSIPGSGLPPNNQYGLSGWTLFGPGAGAPPPPPAPPGGGGGVPEGGTTMLLLGAAIGAFGVARRFVS